MIEQKILDGMPTTGDDAKATHCTEDGVYFLDDDGLLFYWCEFSSMWKSYAQRLRKYNIRSLSDIQTIVDQQKLIAELEKERDELKNIIIAHQIADETGYIDGEGWVANWSEMNKEVLKLVSQRDIEMKIVALESFKNDAEKNIPDDEAVSKFEVIDAIDHTIEQLHQQAKGE